MIKLIGNGAIGGFFLMVSSLPRGMVAQTEGTGGSAEKRFTIEFIAANPI
ncbi:MAG: hypothetical protein WAX67_12925 [Rugosibacter sp.]